MTGFAGMPISAHTIEARHWVADVIYSPLETALLEAARARGARGMGGAGMCVHQAVEAYRLFTGLTPDVARLHRTFAGAAAERERMTKAAD
jgi:shikimate dehydrogenase